MVGIVVVSHSKRLAEGVRELAEQMTQGRVPIAIAGGIDDPEQPIGTDAMAVMAAVSEVYSDDGVVVLMDLGSALLSAETALEFLEPEQQDRVFLCAAPVVEGTMAAAVRASIGGTPAEIMREAESALAAKVEQLGGAAVPGAESPAPAHAAGPGEQITLVVANRLGLHARPAARFVSTAARFDAGVRVSKGERQADAKSINQVATLGVRQGDTIVVSAVGPEAAAALEALRALAADNFGDRDEPATETADQAATTSETPAGPDGVLVGRDGALTGIAASPGVAVGPAAVYRPRLPEVVARTVADPATEWARLEAAVAAARQEIDALYRRSVGQIGVDKAAIFEAHALFLQDPALLDAARETIAREALNAEAAWDRAIDGMASTYRALDDAYMQARAADVEDVGRRVLGLLLGLEPPSLDFAEPSILVAADLTPSDTAQLDPARVLGIATETGGATSHSAILARALGIPAVVGLGASAQGLADGQMIALDGDRGVLWPEPDAATLDEMRDRRDAWQSEQKAAKAAGQGEAVTQDGRRIEVAANVGGPHDIPLALEYGAEGVGLFRTEFLFMDRATAPTEEEQLAAYRQAAEQMAPRPLIIRTLDVGGDKPVPYLDLGEEDNPFLGWRGIRFCLQMPEIFMPQLRAALRASVDEAGSALNVKIMFPMIGTLEEVRAAKAVLDEARQALRAEGLPFDESLEVGIMIEVPSAVTVADQLAREVDFFSIGTNDLTQYVMAADRGNARVAGLADALQPAVLRAIKQAADAAHAAGIWIGMCGELAGKSEATPILLGLGLDELSMSAPSIPAVKEAIRRLTIPEAERIAAQALSAESAAGVRAVLGSRIVA